MNIEELREYCLSIKGSTESLPFIGHNILAFKVMDKLFAYIPLEPKDGIFRVNLKSDPDKSVELREKYTGVTQTDFKALQWNLITLDSDVPDDLIKDLLQHSADEVIKKLPQKKREEYLNIIHIKDCDSTNNSLTETNKKKLLEEGTIVWSDFQSAGKGQRGNGWESQKGKNLLFSILLYPEIKANEQFIISQIISLAVADCLLDYTNDITIKWPNDIYWKEKKICGILVENVLEGKQISQSISGIGININQAKFTGDAPNPVSLIQITEEKHNLFEILNKVRANILKYYGQLKTGDETTIRQRYKDLLFRRDGYYPYCDEKGDFMAEIKDIEPSGLLILQTKDGTEKKYAFKEVKYIL